MIPALANHLLQSTVVGVAAGLLALLLRKHNARWRYWIWFASSMKFFVPLSLFVELGQRISWSTAPVVVQPRVAFVMGKISQPFTVQGGVVATPVRAATAPSVVPEVLIALWICGCAAVLIFWLVRWRRVAAVLRDGTPISEGREIEVLRKLDANIRLISSPSQIEPGVFGILRPVLFLPSKIGEHLDDTQLDAIFAHELSHVRRRDNLTAALHMLVEAAFWFHPLVWWIGARLVEERERACDEEVVRLGSDPEVYADAILRICRAYVESPLACAAGISGADLRKRVEDIMANPRLTRLTFGKKALLGMVGIAALVTPVAIGILNAPAGRAQGPAAFEAADVHPSARTPNPTMSGGVLLGDRYEIHHATMLNLITAAWGLDATYIVGGPPWLDTDRFDIAAKAASGTQSGALGKMLQSLLIERFGLVVRNDTRPIQAYALTVGKGGPRMKASGGDGESQCQTQLESGTGVTRLFSVRCHHETMADFARLLGMAAPAYFGGPVVDRTGMAGAWDIDLKFSPRGFLSLAGADGISLYDAVDKQLGLKLERQQVEMPVIVVERVNEKPTENAPGVTQRLPPAPTEFEVADVKPSAPGENRGQVKFQPGGRIDGRGISLKDVIMFAWDIRAEDLLVGGPAWLDTALYDVVAKAPGTGAQTADVDLEALQPMVRSLLAERFRLTVHNDDRPVQVYALLAAKPKMAKADPANRSGCKMTPGTPGLAAVLSKSYTCTNITMAQFVETLAVIAPGYMHHPGVDLTGLDGAFDFNLSFSNPLQAMARAAGTGTMGASDPNGAITLFEAIERQLGLKLELQKHPMPVLVIDHVEQKPTGN